MDERASPAKNRRAMPDATRPLFERATHGDRRAFDELLALHLPGLRAWIRLRAGPVVRARESASDLAQSVCREVLDHLDRFAYGDEQGFRAWLYTTALRKIANRHEYWAAEKRDHRRESPLDGLGESAAMAALGGVYRSFSSPSRHAMKREEIEHVERAFDRLEEEQREVITLAHVAGLSRAEIAERLGKSEGAVRTMLSRALADLADEVKRPGP
jgi:RNA polymerase sigma-70 factor (ECF subfamily)